MVDHLEEEDGFGPIRDEYEELSEYVHPNASSLMSNTSMTEENKALFAVRKGGFKDKEIRESVRTLIESNYFIIDKLSKIGFQNYRFNFLKEHLEDYEFKWSYDRSGRLCMKKDK